MPCIKVYIHIVWSTKNRYPFLTSYKLRNKVWNHILENAREKGIFIDFIGGYSDHCHCLVSSGANQTIKDLVQLIKGESSFWINKHKLCESQFNWQNDYFAASVSDLMLDNTRNYIKNQEEHHKVKTFNEEYTEFMDNHGFVNYKEELG